MHVAPQNDQLMTEHRILCLKPASRLEWRDQTGQNEAVQSEHDLMRLRDSGCVAILTRFPVHTMMYVKRWLRRGTNGDIAEVPPQPKFGFQ